MTIKELMERANTNQTGRAIAYIKDGLDKMAEKIDDNIKESKINIVKGTREYAIPTDLIRLFKVSKLNSDGNYVKIGRMTHGPSEEK
tara:strand:+ start:3690 stop:3950 length:261 start_codon:yes stop_codon:yes gene_type:complete